MSASEILDKLISESIKVSQALQYTRFLLLHTNSVAQLDWVTNECNGYQDKTTIPNYRKPPCTIYAQVAVPYQGVVTQPVIARELDGWLDEGERTVSVYTMYIGESVENIESVLKDGNVDSKYIQMEFPAPLQNMLINAISGNVIKVYQQTNLSYLVGIITSVKTELINILIQIMQSINMNQSNDVSESTLLKNTHYKRVFISYSYDNHNHELWVKHLADTLKASGVKVMFDKDLPYGADLSSFMVRGIQEADIVLVVGTPTYLQKTLKVETNGVRFEDAVITNSLMNDIDANKFIPILREGTYKDSFPVLLSHRKGIDFSNDTMFDDKIKELLDVLMY